MIIISILASRSALFMIVKTAFILVLFTSMGSAEVVFVSGHEDGQGVLRQLDDQCYLITPQHVIGDNHEVILVTSRTQTHSARLKRRGYADLAILSVLSKKDCPKYFSDGNTIDTLIGLDNHATLNTRSNSGTLNKLPVRIIKIDERQILIEPIEHTSIYKGQSGGLLTISGSSIGMLLSVNAATQYGTVLRQDHMYRILQSWFPHGNDPTIHYIDPKSVLEPIIQSNDLGGLIQKNLDQTSQSNAVYSPTLEPHTTRPRNKSKDN